MASIRVDAPPLELGLFEDQWNAFTNELEGAGHDVEFEDHIEQRSRAQLPPGVEPGTLVLIALYVGKKLAGETLDKVLGGGRRATPQPPWTSARQSEENGRHRRRARPSA